MRSLVAIIESASDYTTTKYAGDFARGYARKGYDDVSVEHSKVAGDTVETRLIVGEKLTDDQAGELDKLTSRMILDSFVKIKHQDANPVKRIADASSRDWYYDESYRIGVAWGTTVQHGPDLIFWKAKPE